MKFIKNKVIYLVLIFIFALSIISCTQNPDDLLDIKNREVGVWWWSRNLDDTYLNFAKNNGVTEIYYNAGELNEEDVSFLQKAKDRTMEVYFLCGEYQWIYDSQNLENKIEDFIIFQQQNEVKFQGIHLDVEPHQSPQFDTERYETILKYIEFVDKITSSYETIKFDFDIPFWLNDEVTYKGKTQEAYKFVIDYADRVFVMSYRDEAEKIFNVAKEEVEYARAKQKTIFLCVETGNEEDIVTFKEEGRLEMNNQLNTLDSLVEKEIGFSIHHIKTWYELKK